MPGTDVLGVVADEVQRCVRSVDPAALERAVDLLDSAPRVFVTGAGRSALAMRGFAMRLMHQGTAAYVVGDVTTPAIAAEDLLVVGSGSGRTPGVLLHVETAKKLGARVILVTIVPGSPIGALADAVVSIPAPSPKAENAGRTVVSQQPLGSLFEQSLLLVCDAMILASMRRHGIDPDDMMRRHANLE